jgi:hypothetical protein
MIYLENNSDASFSTTNYNNQSYDIIYKGKKENKFRYSYQNKLQRN